MAELAEDSRHEHVRVFDFGCGDGGDWPAVLRDCPNIELLGYEPDPQRAKRATERLIGSHATIFTGPRPPSLREQVSRVVSLSVFEHVWDRPAYLRFAHQALAENGLFYLNYDDGHFRVVFDVDQKSLWLAQARVLLHNALAVPLAKLGKSTRFQSRVPRHHVDRLIEEIGFRVVRSYYSNLSNFKELAATLDDAQRCDFAEFWVRTEVELNRKFEREAETARADTSNLWQIMPSRTIVLTRD